MRTAVHVFSFVGIVWYPPPESLHAFNSTSRTAQVFKDLQLFCPPPDCRCEGYFLCLWLVTNDDDDDDEPPSRKRVLYIQTRQTVS